MPRLSVCLCVLIVVPIVVSGQKQDDLFTDLFNRSAAAKQSMKSIRARFTETTTSTLLEKPLVAHGTIVAAPPARVRMTYTDPERRTVVIDGKSLAVAWPDRNQQEKIDISQMQKRIDQYFTNASIGQLRSMFEIGAEHVPSRHGVDRIDMVPKRKQIRQGLERLELWIDTDRNLLVEMLMTFAGGDTKRIVLDDIAVNVPLTDDLFRATR
jgi:outer membrane lipoprotein-sorting protein